MRKGIIVGAVLVSILSVYAISRQTKDTRPCRKLNQICKAAGFKRGHTPSERKSFFNDCLKPLMETNTVGDVQIDPEDAIACKHKWTKRTRNIRQDEDSANEDADDA